MRFLKKLVSKKGQLSMEMGLLVAAAVLVAVIVAYYYATRTKVMSEKASNQANITTTNLQDNTEDLINKIVGVANDVK